MTWYFNLFTFLNAGDTQLGRHVNGIEFLPTWYESKILYVFALSEYSNNVSRAQRKRLVSLDPYKLQVLLMGTKWCDPN
jgi:hypothetical protein